MENLNCQQNAPHSLEVVIGNGFDIDLGLNTRFKDFFESYFFKNNINLQNKGNIYDFINSHFSKQGFLKLKHSIFDILSCKHDIIFKEKNIRWYDIEKELSIIASNNNGKQTLEKLDILPDSFHLLENQLCGYIITQYSEPISQDSTAYRLFDIINNHHNNIVYVDNFNYTDWDKLFPSHNLEVKYLHGKTTDKSIILGIQDNIEIRPGFDYFIKTHNPNFRSHKIMQHLNEANEVIFFGHSFGTTDEHYFSNLFNQLADSNNSYQNKIVRIFTYDEDSRRDILLKLRMMTNKRVEYLFQNCDFELYRTSTDSSRIDEYFSQLKIRLQRWHKPSKGIKSNLPSI